MRLLFSRESQAGSHCTHLNFERTVKTNLASGTIHPALISAYNKYHGRKLQRHRMSLVAAASPTLSFVNRQHAPRTPGTKECHLSHAVILSNMVP